MTDRSPAALRRRYHAATDAVTGATTRADAAALLLACLSGLLAVVVATYLFPYRSPNHDEAVYLQQAAMLLEGQLFLRPPVAESFRPWFFVRAPDGALYSKYGPVPAAMFAVGRLLGDFRLALVAISAGVLGLTHLTVREAFDARHGAVAAGFLLVSPLFVVHAGVFLPYAATAVWTLLFAFAYLRADRTGRARWAAVAGVAVGVAFLSRPYTATLFAAPFVAHAGWRILPRDLWEADRWAFGGSGSSDEATHEADGTGRPGVTDAPLRDRVDRAALSRNLVTAALGLAGVAAALAYNAVVTGDPLLFPYEVFAPADGLGFGRRELLGYGVTYTPALALQANARVVATFFTDWVAGGPVGTLLAAAGLGLLAARAVGGTAGVDSRQAALVGLLVAVPLGNVAFWGNLNVLGSLATPGDGLIAHLGPYYHYDLLLPTAALAAHALLVGGRRTTKLVRDRAPTETRGAAVLAALAVVSAATFAVPAAAAVGTPVARNAEVTAAYAAAYEPVVERSFDDALVFLPTPYGNWLNHPFQELRNDPGYDGDVVYAIRTNQFTVVDAFPERTLYRYTYRGPWVPTAGVTVEPRLQRVRHVAGEGVRADVRLGVPEDAQSVAVRLASAGEGALFAVNGTPDTLPLAVTVAGGNATLDGPVRPVGGGNAVPVSGRETVSLVVYVSTGGGGAFSYRIDVPVLVTDGGVRGLTPYAEVCTTPRQCGGESAYVPGTGPEGAFVDVATRAVNATATG